MVVRGRKWKCDRVDKSREMHQIPCLMENILNSRSYCPGWCRLQTHCPRLVPVTNPFLSFPDCGYTVLPSNASAANSCSNLQSHARIPSGFPGRSIAFSSVTVRGKMMLLASWSSARSSSVSSVSIPSRAPRQLGEHRPRLPACRRDGTETDPRRRPCRR